MSQPNFVNFILFPNLANSSTVKSAAGRPGNLGMFLQFYIKRIAVISWAWACRCCIEILAYLLEDTFCWIQEANVSDYCNP